MGTGGEGAQLQHAPRRGSTALGASRFVIFLSFRTLISGNPVRQHDCRTHDAATKEAESYITPRISQVDYDNECNTCLNTILQLALGGDMSNSPTFFLSHYLYHSALMHLFE